MDKDHRNFGGSDALNLTPPFNTPFNSPFEDPLSKLKRTYSETLPSFTLFYENTGMGPLVKALSGTVTQ